MHDDFITFSLSTLLSCSPTFMYLVDKALSFLHNIFKDFEYHFPFFSSNLNIPAFPRLSTLQSFSKIIILIFSDPKRMIAPYLYVF